MTFRSLWARTVVALVAFALPARTSAQTIVPPAALERTELHSVRSAATNTDYRIYVALPTGYRASDTTRYPVAYVLDGDSQFGIVTQAYRLQALGREVRDAIIVGVGYAGVTTAVEVFSGRSHDMTPTHVASQDSTLGVRYGRPVTTGGAPAFLVALKNDIIPFVEHRFATSTERVFLGHSFGGLFGTYVLFHEPELFSGYLLGSPSLWWDDGISFRYEEQYAQRRRDLPVRVVLSVGALENDRMVQPIKRLADVMTTRNYSGLTLSTVVFDGETHVSGIPATLSHGVRVLLAPANRKP